MVRRPAADGDIGCARQSRHSLRAIAVAITAKKNVLTMMCRLQRPAGSGLAQPRFDMPDLIEFGQSIDEPSQIEAELTALRAEAEWLVRTPGARKRVQSIAAALLREGTLTGEQSGL